LQLASLEAHQLLVARTRCGRGRSQAQAGSDPSHPMLGSQPAQGLAGPTSASISWSIPRGHRAHRHRRSFTQAYAEIGPATGATVDPTSKRWAGSARRAHGRSGWRTIRRCAGLESRRSSADDPSHRRLLRLADFGAVGWRARRGPSAGARA
jgi:hypothetical protein